ncbi:hypothetical protein GO684_00940 [Wolbachia endosymbiont of Litomosoides brasiliensis]|nr:hypothetical protein [Wolbachia endosymbiont of Litomosoides brasiliensis]NUY39298.1 hypothetical protein [Wolbachia endosymbiont of Litomosoides brasiliensis]
MLQKTSCCIAAVAKTCCISRTALTAWVKHLKLEREENCLPLLNFVEKLD